MWVIRWGEWLYDPRDWWIGVYVKPLAPGLVRVYICAIPCFPFTLIFERLIRQ